MSILNVAAYKFITLDKLPTLQQSLHALGKRLAIRGTILLAPEGINLMLAGDSIPVNEFLTFIKEDSRFSDLFFKESFSELNPFDKFKVRIKPEIITMDPSINPAEQTAPHLDPIVFKHWLDEKRDVVILDTRNRYEVDKGTFDNAIDLNTDHFRDFPTAAKQLDESLKDKTLVMFCTGGVRCEKASVVLMQQGFKDVYQLDGGILNYFEKCGDAHYHGDCFVFDERIAVNPQLEVQQEKKDEF